MKRAKINMKFKCKTKMYIGTKKFAPLSAENLQNQHSIVTPVLALTVSLYECRHTLTSFC